jgi:hypothetical protein
MLPRYRDCGNRQEPGITATRRSSGQWRCVLHARQTSGSRLAEATSRPVTKGKLLPSTVEHGSGYISHNRLAISSFPTAYRTWTIVPEVSISLIKTVPLLPPTSTFPLRLPAPFHILGTISVNVTVWALPRSTLIRVGIAHVRLSIYVAHPTSDSQFSAVLPLFLHRHKK